MFWAAMRERSLISWKRRSFWGWRANVSSLGATIRGRRGSGIVGPPARQGVGEARACGSGDGSGDALSDALLSGFTAKHFHEQLVQRHNFAWSYTWMKTFLHSKGLLERAKRRRAHRRKRRVGHCLG